MATDMGHSNPGAPLIVMLIGIGSNVEREEHDEKLGG